MKNRLLKTFGLAATVSILAACGGGGGGSSSSSGGGSSSSSSTGGGASFDYTAMFTNLADNVIIPNYNQFQTLAADFASDTGALHNYCAAIGSENEQTTLAAAKTAWAGLMSQWQRVELHNFGPVASQDNFLRRRVAAFDERPLDSCRTDRAVVLAEAEGFDIASRVENARGLGAAEYLLYETTLNHTCTESNDQTDPWNARSEAERKLARCEYVKLIANEVNETATTIHNGWIASGDDFRSSFINGSSETILELISDALFYLEKETKDLKVGVPTGIHSDCSTAACPEEVESPYSQTSLQNIRANVVSFLSLYSGEEGSSFDDIIIDANQSSVNEEFVDNLGAVIDLIDTMIAAEQTLQGQAQAVLDSGDETDCANSNANPDTVQTVQACSLHGLLKRVTDRMRTDFITIVGVDLPDRAQSDND